MEREKNENNKEPEPITVSSLPDFIKEIDEITKKLSYIYIFRGQSNEKWKVKSWYHRDNKKSDNKNDIAYSENLLKEAERYNKETTVNIELLADLQHLGAKTVFIDFTKNALIALYFACNKPIKKNGKVFCLPIAPTSKNYKNLNDNPKEEIKEALSLQSSSNDVKNFIPPNNEKTMLISEDGKQKDFEFAMYKPSFKNNNRPLKQDSILLYIKNKPPPSLLYKEFLIPHDKKKSILKQLKHIVNISPITIFPDLPGFATHHSSMDEEDYCERGNQEYDRKNYKDAIANYNKAIKLDNQYAYAYFFLGMAYVQLDNLDNAIEKFTKAINLNIEDIDVFFNRGLVYYYQKQYENAIADYNKAITLNPKYEATYNNRGIVYYRQQQYEKAIADYDKAIKLNPKYETAYNNRGIVYAQLSNPEKAIDDYNKAIKFDSKYENAFFNRGIVYAQSGKYAKAIKDYTKVIKLNLKFEKAYTNRGVAYTLLGKYKNAIADFTQAFELNANLAALFPFLVLFSKKDLPTLKKLKAYAEKDGETHKDVIQPIDHIIDYIEKTST